MKIFISWSREKSKTLANCLRDWLPQVIQSADPWMSESDIDAGARWNQVMSGVLSETTFGIICLTKENQSEPWIMFESGALAKTIEKARVCPLLIDMEPSDIKPGPLTQFQSKKAIKEQIFDLLKTINIVQDQRLSERILRDAFEKNWPELKKVINDLPEERGEPESRSPNEMIPEILEIVRGLARTEISTKPDIDSTIEELEIGVRTYEKLKRAGISTVEDLFDQETELSKLGLNKNEIKKIERILNEIAVDMSAHFASPF